MAEPWQQWMPHDIDSWQGSANIQALSDLAYRAVHNLLQDMWKQADCSLPIEDRELAKRSRVAARWNECREEVLDYFCDRTDDGRITHRVLLKKWQKAHEVYESRQAAAKKTNSTRSAHGDRNGERMVSDSKAQRSADTGTRTGTGTEVLTTAGEVPLISATNPKPDPIRDAVDRLFAFYCLKFNLKPHEYTLSSVRRQQAESRLHERIRARLGDVTKAEADLAQAIENLWANEYMRSRGLTDWGDQIFKSQEEFEKRMNWKPEAGNGTNRSNSSPAVERGVQSRSAIGAAAARRYGIGVVGHDGADAGAVPTPSAATRDTRHVLGRVGRDGAPVRTDDFAGCTLEGVP